MTAIAALERVLLTVEAELTALHTGKVVDQAELGERLRNDLTSPPHAPSPAMQAPVAAAPQPKPPAPPVSPAATPPPPPRPNPPAPVPVGAQATRQPFAGTWPPRLDRPATRTGNPQPPPPTARPVGASGPIGHPHPNPSQSPSSFGLERVFRIGGISLVVLAAIFFVSTAISRGWIGPTAQLTLAGFASLAIIGQSFRFATEQRPWRITMAIGGAIALFASGVVGHFGLDLLSIEATLVWLGATIVAFLALGRAHDSEAIAAVGAPMAVLGTFLFAASGDAPALVTAVLGIAWGIAVLIATREQRWFAARGMGAAATGFIILLATLAEPIDGAITFAVSLGIATVVALAVSQILEYSIVSAEGAVTPLAQIEARLFAVTIPLAVLLMSTLVNENFDGTEIGWFVAAAGLSATAIITALASRMHPTMTMLHQLAGIGTATIGFVTVLDGPVLVAVLLAQAAITAAFAFRTSAPEMIIGAVLLASIPAGWTTVMIALALGGEAMTIGELVVTGLVVGTVAVSGYALRNQRNLELAWIGAWIGVLYWVAAAFQGVPQGQMAVSLTWAAISVALIVSRKALWDPARFRSVIYVALGTLLLTGAKLIFVDLVAVDVLWRAGLFFLIGGTFMRLAFVLPEMLEGPGQDEIVTEREKQPV